MIDGDLPMDGDRGRLRQVIDNLLTNSLRYTESGGFSRIVEAHRGSISARSAESGGLAIDVRLPAS